MWPCGTPTGSIVRRKLQSNSVSCYKEAIDDALAILDEQEQEEILAVSRPLARLALGEYGSCEVCGKGIEVERLS
jgi:RNA polymerase-binding transcription factor DksA